MHIFISGAATGIGAATTQLFIERGWCVSAIDINEPAVDTLRRSVADSDRLCVTIGDTRCKDDLRDALAAGVEAFGPPDSIFANAGIHQSNTILDITDDELERIIDINIYGTVNTLRAALPQMIGGGRTGSVVINCSDQWFIGKAHSFAYGMTKGALGQITRSLAIDLAPHGIRVNAICPGTIDTPLVDGVFERLSARTGRAVADYKAEEDALFARGAMGTPDEVAKLVYYLAGPDAAFITGSHYLIDGGLCAGR